MIDYGSMFWFNGRWSTDFGLFVNPHGEFRYPKRIVNKIKIPGSNRSIVIFDGFEDVEETFEMMLLPDNGRSVRERAFNVIEWLYSTPSYSRFEYSEEPNHFRLGYYDGDGKREDRFATTGLLEANFVFRPERWLKSGEDKGSFSNPYKICGNANPSFFPAGDSIINPTSYSSKPLLHLPQQSQASKTFTITGESEKSYIITLSGTGPDGGIVIDCETGNAFGYNDNSVSYNNIVSISGGLPVLEPGVNMFSSTGTGKTYIVPRWHTY